MTVERRYISPEVMKRLCCAEPRIKSEAESRETWNLLEPTLLILNVCSHKLFVRLGQIDYAFDDAHNACESTSDNTQRQLNDSFSGVPKYELVYSEIAEKDRTDADRNFLVGA